MREQSHIDDMRAAIRGDRERSRIRPRPSPVVERQEAKERPAEPERRRGILASLFRRG
jgi:hypothetical protein